jgi:uncharacterized protein (TIGR03086 family)
MANDQQLTRLIEHGRDREAAELASHLLAPADSFSDPLVQLDAILPMLSGLVANLDFADLDRPTPCANFTVRGVLEHMIAGATMFAGAFRGRAPADVTISDPLSGFGIAMADLQSAVHSVGAMDRTIAAPFGDVPGDVFARFVAMDGLVHGWDITTAIGVPYEPADALVAAVDAFAREAIADGMRDGDTFAATVEPPAGAPPIVKLAAFTGRQVALS